MAEGIRAPNLPLRTDLSEFLGIQTDGTQKSLGRFTRASVIGNLEAIVNSFVVGGGVIFKTLAQALAALNYPANQMAWVIQDSTPANNGIYQKTGSSGSGTWGRVGDLPYSFYRAVNEGAGTANAIMATNGYPMANKDALIVVNITDTNTGSPVTLSLNDATPIPIKTASGNDIAVGGLLAGMVIAGYINNNGLEFRLLSDQASAAIQAAAEAAAATAEAARDIATGAMSVFLVHEFATYALTASYHPTAAPDYIRTIGRADVEDGGGGTYWKNGTDEGELIITQDDGTTDVGYTLLDNPIRFEHFGAFGGAVGSEGSSLTDESAAMQDALDFAEANGRVVELTARYFGISDTLVLGDDVVIDAKNKGGAIVNKVTTAGVRVSHRSKLIGNVTLLGTGTTNLYPTLEKLIYPAVASCSDCEFDVTLGNATVGLWGEYIDGNPANLPRRWKGVVRSHPTLPIIGEQGVSEGYLFLGTMRDSRLTIHGKDTARHDNYLGAGAVNNYVEVYTEGCMNFAAQINTYVGQPESSGNHVIVFARSLGRGVVGSSGAVAIVGNSSRNIIEVSQQGGNTDYCVVAQGADDASTTPRGNQIICRDVTGSFLGADVIKLENEDTTQVKGSIAAKATASVIGIRRAGTTGALHGAMIDNISIDTFGGNIPCVLDNITDIPTYIGPGKYRNSATSPTAAPIQDNSSGKRYGYVVEYSGLFSATGAAGGTSGGVTDFNVTMPGKLDPTYRKPAVSLTVGFGSVTSAVPLSAIAGTIVNTDAVLPIRVFNGHTASQDVPVFWRVAGDPALT